jgi:hypothetical protein
MENSMRILMLFCLLLFNTPTAFATGDPKLSCSLLVVENAEDSSEGAKKVIETFYAGDPTKSQIKNWKRTRKWKEGVIVHRSFLAADGTQVLLSFNPANNTFRLFPMAPDTSTPVVKSNLKFPDPLANKNKYGNYNSEQREWAEEFTGVTIWSWGHDHPDGLDFYCGPESFHGLFDQEHPRTENFLRELFADRPSIQIAAAESFHEVPLKPGETIDQLKALIRDRLTQAGAQYQP